MEVYVPGRNMFNRHDGSTADDPNAARPGSLLNCRADSLTSSSAYESPTISCTRIVAVHCLPLSVDSVTLGTREYD